MRELITAQEVQSIPKSFMKRDIKWNTWLFNRKVKKAAKEGKKFVDMAAPLPEGFLNNLSDDALKEFTPESVCYIIDDAVKLQILGYILGHKTKYEYYKKTKHGTS